MAGRSAAPKPTEAEPTKRRRYQRKRKIKIEDEPVTAVSSAKTEKEVLKLINCLAEWTRDLQAARSVNPSVPPNRSRPRSGAQGGATGVPRALAYPRGNPLTESMEFTDRDGTVWLAYIEGARPSPSRPSTGASILPERHLRFDSPTESRFTSVLPAGSPFLAEARLQALLDEAQPDLPLAPSSGSSARAICLGSRVSDSSTQAIESGRGAIADWSRQLRRVAGRSEELRRQLLSGAVNSMQGLVEVLLSHRPARL